MATILITGGTGMIGTRLSGLLIGKGYDLVILSRKLHAPPAKWKGKLRYAIWDLHAQTIDREAIATADHIIHLAGEGVADKRWTEDRRQEILRSRTQSSQLLVKSLREIPNHVQTVVSASAIGWYGPDTEVSRRNGFREDEPADSAFLGETCRLWEESIQPVEVLGKRLVKLRTGIVLGMDGGALHEFRKPLQFGIAAILGAGKQVVSWIQLDDLCRIYIEAIENPTIHGAYNAIAPQPVTNKELTMELARQVRGKYFVPVHVPVFALKLALGEMSIEVLKSATVSAGKISSTGFKFLYPDIASALKASL